MGWLYVPGVEPSNSDSMWQSPDIELSVSLSGKAVLRPLSWREWRTRPWVRLLSGAISPPSTADAGVDAWISSLRDSRASRSASPAINVGWMTSATSGPMSPASLASAERSGCSSKTSPASSQPSLLTDEPPSRSSSMTSKGWITKLRSASSQRRRLAGHIFANASSSWPTPDAGARQGHNRSMSEGAAERPLLAEAAKHWPTPDANTATYSNGRFGRNLREAASLWATPSVADLTGGHAARGGDRSEEMLLPGQARVLSENWPPPRAEDMEGVLNHPGAIDSLTGAARLWPTPENADASRGSDTHVRGNPTLLGASRSFLQGETTRIDGEPSSAPGPSSPRQLNPVFVEWLMGWPLGWTDPGSPLPATEWSRWLRHMRSSLCTLGWEAAE